jgi:hypothetical protein
LPIFLAAGLGAIFWRVVRPDIRSLARVTFYILSPCLVFTSLSANALPVSEFRRLAGFAAATVLVAGALAWVAGHALRLRRSMVAALMLTCMFVKSGNYGLSLNLFAFSEGAMARAVVYYVISTLGMYSLGVFVASSGSVGAGSALKSVLKVPALYALALAGMLRWQRWDAPEWVRGPVDLLGGTAIPVMLLILGMQIAQAPRSLQWRWVGLAATLRMLVMPVVAFGLASLYHLTGPARRAGIIEAAMPSAVIVAVLALEYDLEPLLVTDAVVLITLIGPFTLMPLIALLQGLTRPQPGLSARDRDSGIIRAQHRRYAHAA